MAEIDVPVRRRSIYTSPDRQTVSIRTVPAVLISSWRAADGSTGIAMVNISQEPADFTLEIDQSLWNLTGEESIWELDENSQRHLLGCFEKELELALKPGQARILELAAE